MSTKTFGVVDYILFGLILLCSSLIGIYFAYKQRKNATSAEYLVANRSLGWFPIFVSLLATFYSAIGVMGLPSQIYSTGITFCFHNVGFIIPLLLGCYVFGPMYRKLKIVSVNEYLEKRFSSKVRMLGAILFLLQNTSYMGVALYTPCLALESVAGVPMYATILSTGAVCTFYTALGGMKAVIWTDVFQSAIMFTGLLITLIVGTKEAGSISEIIDFNQKMERLKIDFSFDPRHIHTIWGCVVGITFTSVSTWTVRQTFLQRFISARSLRDARIAMVGMYIGTAVVITILSIDALILFKVYGGCDLIMSKAIHRNDQILPYFVIDKLGHLTGMPGLFTACLFSFSLSTLSSGLNSMSAQLLEDFAKKIKPGMTEKQGTNFSKISAVIGGIITTVFAFLVPYFGKYVLRIIILLAGIFNGPMLAMFALGIFTRTANKFGVMIGSFIGVIIGLFFAIGQIVYSPKHELPPLSIRECSFFNSSTSNTDGIIYRPESNEQGFARMFSISYIWIGCFPVITTLISGYLISKCTDRYIEDDVDERLLFKWKESYLYRKVLRKGKSSKYKVDNTLLAEKENKEAIQLDQIQSPARSKEDRSY